MRPLPKWLTHPNEPTSILIMMSTEREDSSPNPFFPGNLLLLHYHFGWSTVQNRRGKEVRSEEFRMGREKREVTILGEREQREIRTATTDR